MNINERAKYKSRIQRFCPLCKVTYLSVFLLPELKIEAQTNFTSLYCFTVISNLIERENIIEMAIGFGLCVVTKFLEYIIRCLWNDMFETWYSFNGHPTRHFGMVCICVVFVYHVAIRESRPMTLFCQLDDGMFCMMRNQCLGKGSRSSGWYLEGRKVIDFASMAVFSWL